MSSFSTQKIPIFSNKKFNKLITLTILSSLFIIALVIAIVAGINSTKPKHNNIIDHYVLKTSCSTTRYPSLCYSSVVNSPIKFTRNLTTQRDIIEISINITTTVVQHNFFTVNKLLTAEKKHLTKREKTALHDCLETIDDTLDELRNAVEDLNLYPNKKSLTQHANDLKTLISAAITNQETCLDGFSHDGAEKHVRDALIAGQRHVEQMCSNALAMIKNMTDSDIANFEKMSTVTGTTNRKLKEWPEWLSTGDRRLLQSSTVKADVVVAADGSGDFKSVAAAVEAAPNNSISRYVIKIKAGIYRENVEVGKKKKNIMFLGEGRTKTIITANRNFIDGSTTFKSATVAAVGDNFLARDLTFENTAGPSKHQAVALRVGSDLSAFYNCDILAYQDTLYVHSKRQFFINCLIAGTVDFIFGNAAVVFQDCDIHARRPNPGQKNMVTAQGRTDPNQNTGIVIQKCRIGATSDLEAVKTEFSTYLGRPWKEYSRTVVMESILSDVIREEGWHEWNGDFALKTLVYREYMNSGDGSDTSGRVKWKGFEVIRNVSEAQDYSLGSFIGGTSWLESTGFPFFLNL